MRVDATLLMVFFVAFVFCVIWATPFPNVVDNWKVCAVISFVGMILTAIILALTYIWT